MTISKDVMKARIVNAANEREAYEQAQNSLTDSKQQFINKLHAVTRSDDCVAYLARIDADMSFVNAEHKEKSNLRFNVKAFAKFHALVKSLAEKKLVKLDTYMSQALNNLLIIVKQTDAETLTSDDFKAMFCSDVKSSHSAIMQRDKLYASSTANSQSSQITMILRVLKILKLEESRADNRDVYKINRQHKIFQRIAI